MHPSSGRPIEFDVFVSELSLAVEYQGKQHYEIVDRFDGKDPEKAQQNLDERQERDQVKRDQATENNIKLWEIQYSDWDGSLDYVIDTLQYEFNVTLSREVILKNARERSLVDGELIYEND